MGELDRHAQQLCEKDGAAGVELRRESTLSEEQGATLR